MNKQTPRERAAVTELDKRFWLRVEMHHLVPLTQQGPGAGGNPASVPFRVTHHLFLLANHKPGAELLRGGKWKLHEQRNA